MENEGMKKRGIALLLLFLPVVALGIWKGARKVKLAMTVETDLFSQGQIELNRGNFSSAIEVFDTFLARDPKHVPALQFKLTAELRAGRPEAAWATAERILKIDPSATNKAFVAELFRQTGKEAEARRLLNLPDPVPSATPVNEK
jgi:tetratricopeptide (TPR) repeat protein